eukprot:TRINITY_DN9202_c0_g1_i2.p1 TRINITY_DN9202_c0_g1~~TRINITY_DN9202_c0_g1_i2.p1  ORF type:complete len:1757 (-),score=362.44 TRINITY_DN9202_c0_g1_i2:85-5355(-)
MARQAEAIRLDAELEAALELGSRSLGLDQGFRDLPGQGIRLPLSRFAPQPSEDDDDDDDEEADGDGFPELSGSPEDSLLQDGTPHSAASPTSDSSPRDSGDNIRVFVRVRPLNAREGSAHFRDTIRTDTDSGMVHLLAEPPRTFAFDGVLGESASQDEVFKLFGTSVGEACLSGYNGSIYVYGQTGSGKTHTMQGPVDSVQSMHTDERRGLMCRILELIFSEISRRHREGGSIQYSCKCSYLEIYKEQITDLLEPSSSNLQVREDINRGIYVERLSEHSAWTVSDAFHVLWKGLHQRHIAATQMNELSSRSHSVFTLKLEASSTTAGGVTSTRVARLNLIDLAGSERQSFDPHNPSLHESLRVKEAGAINRSLSALTNVIMSLSHVGRRRNSGGGQRRPFVRYRDSKLTFLLRDSLGGNSKTVIVACASPSALCFGETLSTLKFAARAKHIRCAAVMNEEYSGTVESLMLEVKSLRQQLELLSSRGLLPRGASSTASLPAAAESFDRRAAPPGRAAGGRSAYATKMEGSGRGDDYEERISEAMLASSGDDLRRQYGPRRIRRLEILLAAALERERRCELRRHKLEKFTQYLDSALERKEQYFDALRDYFAYLVDHAAGEACYLPEFTARLVVFRQQLCNASTDSSRQQATEMLDGTIEAFLAAEATGLLDESAGSYESSPDRMVPEGDMSPQRWLANELTASRSRSYSYGLLMGEAARRSGRKSSSQVLQLRASASRLMRGASLADGLQSPSASSAALPEPESGGSAPPLDHAFSGTAAGPAEEKLANLRSENKLLRRQLESHPELHRLGAENRLLREHLASIVQQQALAHEEPAWPRGHRHARRAMDGSGVRSGSGGKPTLQPDKEVHSLLARDRSLTRTSKSSVLINANAGCAEGDDAVKDTRVGGEGCGLVLQPFPGIEEVTHQSSSSESSEGEDSDSYGRVQREASGTSRSDANTKPAGRGSSAVKADVTAFLPTMARQVEELFRVITGLEDQLRQLLIPREPKVKTSPLAGSRFTRVYSTGGLGEEREKEVEIDSLDASEALRCAEEAVRCAEGMLAKGGNGQTLLLGSGEDQVFASSGAGLRNKAEGMDERDVFLSLMRSLPGENLSLSRQGFASSAPHLPGSGLLGGGAPGGSRRSSGAGLGGMPTLRASSSTGSAGSRMQRIRSTMQLHRIVEAPAMSVPDSPVSPGGRNLAPLSDHSSPGDKAPVSSPDSPGASEATGPGDVLKSATQQVRGLCQHLGNVGEAYREVQDQLAPMQQEYLRRLDECRFLEAQCRRLDVHCRALEERVQAAEASGAIPRSTQTLQPEFKKLKPESFGSMQQAQALSTALTGSGSSSRIASMGSWSSRSGSQAALVLSAAAPCTQAAQAGQPPVGITRSASAVLPTARSYGMAMPAQGSGPSLGASARQLSQEARQGLTSSCQVSLWSHSSLQPCRTQEMLRRVVSAPQLQPTAYPQVSLDPSAGVAMAVPSEGAAQGINLRPCGGASSVDTETPNLEAAAAPGDPGFKSSVFLSLAQKPGARNAAWQYLVSSTSNVLSVAANSEVIATASAAALASVNSTSSLAAQGGSGSSSALVPPAAAPANSGSMYWASQNAMGTPSSMPAAASASSSTRPLSASGAATSVHQQKENWQNQPSQLGELLGATFVSMASPSSAHSGIPPRLDLSGLRAGSGGGGGVVGMQQPRSARMAGSMQPHMNAAHSLSGSSIGAQQQQMPQHYQHHLLQQAGPPAAGSMAAPRRQASSSAQGR